METMSWLPELLADMEAMGASLDEIEEVVGRLAPDEIEHMLDLGCGKGAVCMALAERFPWRFTGLDLQPAFLDEARQAAQRRGVADRCEFRVADIRDALRELRDFDLVVYASMGDLLGPLDRTVERLRQTARPGGWLLIDSAFCSPGADLSDCGYKFCHTLSETREQLIAHGDTLVAEQLTSSESTRELNDRYLEVIHKRLPQLVEKYPDRSEALEYFVHSQETACDLMNRYVTRAVWLLQTASDAA